MYFSNIWEFLSQDPREANTEGGIFPAIFGTVMMTLIMAVIVTPFGVLAAVYLREYARQGPMTRLIRIAVNNLAGVPAIVYSVSALVAPSASEPSRSASGIRARPSSVATMTTGTANSASVSDAHSKPGVPKVGAGNASGKNNLSRDPPST